jgi:hypothetical protein
VGIYDEIITDLEYQPFVELCDMVYKKPYTFLTVNCTKPLDRMYIEFKYRVVKSEEEEEEKM